MDRERTEEAIVSAATTFESRTVKFSSALAGKYRTGRFQGGGNFEDQWMSMMDEHDG